MPLTTPDAAPEMVISLTPTNSMLAIADVVFSGIFKRVPTLPIAMSENGIVGDAAIGDMRRREGSSPILIGSEGARLVDELDVQPSDIEVPRIHGMTPFTSAALDQILRNLATDHRGDQHDRHGGRFRRTARRLGASPLRSRDPFDG